MNKHIFGKFAKYVGIGVAKCATAITAIILIVAGVANIQTQVGIILNGLFQLIIIIAATLVVGVIWGIFLLNCMYRVHEECEKTTNG